MRQVLYEAQLGSGRVVRVVQNDITTEEVDAIVNAANGRLAHGGGVAGAIARAGGFTIQRDSDAWVRAHGPVPTGGAAITGAGSLPCRYVIHAVGPVWANRGDEPAQLASAVRSALDLADRYALRSVSMPGISSGIYGFPKPLCAEVMLGEIRAWLDAHPDSSVREVNACNIDAHTARLFQAEAERRFGA
ncbi:MAG: macro domain-containing protein [Anaerolineae bacterium]|nr:macro domain-containing protein [Anaerolineae bacterium]